MTTLLRLQTTSADGTQLQLYRWNDDGEKNIFLLHGYVSHGQRLSTLATSLAALGYRITALDLRGHGQSGGKQGEIDLWLRYTEDVLAAIATIRAPFYAIAQGASALSLLSTMQGSITPTLKGVILSNPLLGVIPKPSATQRLLLRLLLRLPIPSSKRKGFRWDQLAFDADVTQSYQHDPQCFSHTSLCMIQHILCAQQRVFSYAQQYPYPMFMLLSPNDSIADVSMSQQFFQKYAGPKSHKEYLRSAHLLLEDQEREEVVADIHAWIGERESQKIL